MAGVTVWHFAIAGPSPSVGRVVTPGAIGPCTWFVSLDGTTPVAEAMVGGLSVSPGDNIVGTAGEDMAVFLNNIVPPSPTSTLTNAGTHLCFGSGGFAFTSQWTVTADAFAITGESSSNWPPAGNGTVLYWPPSYSGIALKIGSNVGTILAPSPVTISNIAFFKNGGGATGTAIDVEGTNWFRMDHVNVYGPQGGSTIGWNVALELNGTVSAVVTNPVVTSSIFQKTAYGISTTTSVEEAQFSDDLCYLNTQACVNWTGSGEFQANNLDAFAPNGDPQMFYFGGLGEMQLSNIIATCKDGSDPSASIGIKIERGNSQDANVAASNLKADDCTDTGIYISLGTNNGQTGTFSNLISLRDANYAYKRIGPGGTVYINGGNVTCTGAVGNACVTGFNNGRDIITNVWGINPIGKITSFIGSNGGANPNTIGGCGTGSSVVASTDYTVCETPIMFASSAGTGVSITVKDSGGNTIYAPGATLSVPFYVSVGEKVNFGAFSVAPTVTVWGVG